MKSHPRYWRKSAAPVAAALIGLGACNAQALSLGKVKVQSALGQSLQAEIDISDLSEEDSKSLKSALATPATFVGMGLEFNQALNGAQIALQRRPNGNRYLKLVSTRPLNDPFVDLVVELSWASGRIVRTYTILLDPPKTQDSASATVLPAPSGEAQPSQSAAATPVPVPSPASAANAISSTAAPVASKLAPSAPVGASAPQAVSPSERKRIRVGKGDTAGKLARSMVPEGVSVEQMLVAMLSTNPAAFVGGNVNRLRAGVELSVPDASVALKTTQPEARQMLDAQNNAFQNLRRSMATQVPAMSAPAGAQEAVGSLAKPAATSTPKVAPSDKLKLSKDSVQSKADKDSMEQIAKQRAKTEASERAAELAKNIEELNQLAKVAAKPEQAAAVSSATEPALPASPASSPANGGIAIAPALPVKPAEPTLSVVDLLDSTVQNTGLLAGLLALLGLGGYSLYRRKRSARPSLDLARKDGISQWETSANTSFDTVGGQRVDTTDANTAGLVTMVYPDSQLEMVNELDPVAEAEVYLAYGKDVPAEEILKEGLQQDPTRVAIHLKLLGIFAKRGDLKSFEAMAQEVRQIVDIASPEWTQVQDMGKSVDPSNPIYGHSVTKPTATMRDSVLEPSSLLSLDVQPSNDSLNASTTPTAAAVNPYAAAPAAASKTPAKISAQSSDAMDFDLASLTLSQPAEKLNAKGQGDDRLDASLALAEQFIAIDEKEGARALLQEVIADGNDSLRQRAKALLTQVQ